MPAFLETIAPGIHILRGGSKAVEYGDDYTLLAVVLSEGNRCHIKGFLNRSDDPSPVHTMVDIGRCLRQAGFTKITWERKRLDGLKPVAIKL